MIVVVKTVLALLPLFLLLASRDKQQRQLGCRMFVCYDQAKYQAPKSHATSTSKIPSRASLAASAGTSVTEV